MCGCHQGKSLETSSWSDNKPSSWNADVLPRAAEECFWDSPDYDELGQKPLIALKGGTAKQEKRFLPVTEHGNTCVVRIFHMPVGNVKCSTSWPLKLDIRASVDSSFAFLLPILPDVCNHIT
jgi:hypothetical protein